ncbi:uncharacterized protein LOC125045231 [Penaeus chinensis]|uniref:uncharacterized protein LOC125045231 n=1 Tax=Penaeus chinensis TaxID=139456 RepID=UPI001FB83F73|nr:uncharacterized protein LOC125045231 [Penaeus chinensis]
MIITQSMKKEMASRQQEAARRMAQRQMALQVASVRERLEWFAPFLLSSATFLLLGYRKTRSSVVLYPLVPMCFALGYQVDFAFGNKTNRIKNIAEGIMRHEGQLIHVPEWHYSDPPQAKSRWAPLLSNPDTPTPGAQAKIKES